MGGWCRVVVRLRVADLGDTGPDRGSFPEVPAPAAVTWPGRGTWASCGGPPAGRAGLRRVDLAAARRADRIRHARDRGAGPALHRAARPAGRRRPVPHRPAGQVRTQLALAVAAALLSVARVISLRDLGLYAARAFRGVLLLPRRIPVRRGESVIVPGWGGRRSPRNRNPREAEAGSFSVT